MKFSRFSPVQFFFAPDDGANATGATTQGTPQTTSTTSDTSASDGKNTAPTAEGAADSTAANPQNTDTQTDPTADSQASEQNQEQNGFKPISSQADLDRIIKERLDRQKTALKADQERQKLEAEGKWKELYEGEKTSFETDKATLEARLAELETQLQNRDQATLIERAIGAHRLDKDAADLFRDAVEGKGLDARALDERARKFAKVVAAPVAPSTEGGQTSAAAQAATQKNDHYSFNPPNGVKW